RSGYGQTRRKKMLAGSPSWGWEKNAILRSVVATAAHGDLEAALARVANGRLHARRAVGTDDQSWPSNDQPVLHPPRMVVRRLRLVICPDGGEMSSCGRSAHVLSRLSHLTRREGSG